MTKETNCLRVKKKQIKGAIEALTEFQTKYEEENPGKKPLLEEPDHSPILLSVTLKKIPKLSSIRMIKVPLPHTLVTDVTEVCLITGDLDKRDRKADIEPTIQHYKELLSKCKVNCVSEIIPLRQLRTEYKPYEARRKLFGAYDFFLADNKITQCLPAVLGKFFFKKRKFPQQINLQTSNVKNQIENALSRTTFFLTGRGNSCTAQVAHLGLSTRQKVENIEAAIKALADSVPGSWKNINGLYIKTPRSISIPLHVSFESGNDIELAPEKTKDVEAEEISTLKGKKVKVYPDGSVEVFVTDESDMTDEDNDSDNPEIPLRKKSFKSGKLSRNKKLKPEVHGKETETVSMKRKQTSDDTSVGGKTQTMLKKKKKRSVENCDIDKVHIVLTKKKMNEEKVGVLNAKRALRKKKLRAPK